MTGEPAKGTEPEVPERDVEQTHSLVRDLVETLEAILNDATQVEVDTGNGLWHGYGVDEHLIEQARAVVERARA